MMIKQILAIASIAFVSNSVNAQNMMSVNKDQHIHSWCLNHEIDEHMTCAVAIGHQAQKDGTLIFYVNRTTSKTTQPSDSVQFFCKSTEVTVKPGNAYVCALKAGESVWWQEKPEALHNGADGYIVYAE